MALAGIIDEETKSNIFKMKAGSKLLDILDNTPNKDGPDVHLQPFSNAMHRLSQYFGSRDYVLLQHQKLRSLPQGSEEPDMKYVQEISLETGAPSFVLVVILSRAGDALV